MSEHLLAGGLGGGDGLAAGTTQGKTTLKLIWWLFASCMCKALNPACLDEACNA
jgi:hypothetical protein